MTVGQPLLWDWYNNRRLEVEYWSCFKIEACSVLNDNGRLMAVPHSVL